jgi:hypothetical protein
MQNQIAEGQILAGKYRIERVLGQGGMGMVVAAHHIHLDEKVAIKFLLPDAVTSAEIVGRFVREARAAVRIKSEHVARVSDVGTLEGGEPYMVMEYLEGSDLAAWVEQRGALPVEQAVEFVLQASEAIAEAHALGIVHRDLKPANLFVVRRADGLLSIKVLDFGISKVSALSGSGVDANMTRTSAVLGSPLYMPPEQMVASRNVDARSDIWALGVILYELLAGTAPFSGETLPEVCVKIATEPPPPIRGLRPDVPPALEAVILRCLEKDRARRYLNIADLAHALIDFGPQRARASVERITRTIQASGLSATVLAAPPGSEATSRATQAVTAGAGAGTAAQWGRTTAGQNKKTRTVVLIGALVVVVLGALAFGLTRGQSSAAVREASSAAALAAPPSAIAAPSVSIVASGIEPTIAPAPQLAVAPPASAAPAAKDSPLKNQGHSAPPIGPAKHATVTVAPRPAQKNNIFDDR